MSDNRNNCYRMPSNPGRCQLCQRTLDALTKHHLIPRTRHRKKRAQRRFSIVDMRTRILWVCRPCHSHIHNVFSEKELESRYNTGEALLAHPSIERFVAWIKPAGFKPGSRAQRR